jgi:hypothetical protein
MRISRVIAISLGAALIGACVLSRGLAYCSVPRRGKSETAGGGPVRTDLDPERSGLGVPVGGSSVGPDRRAVARRGALDECAGSQPQMRTLSMAPLGDSKPV